MQTASTPYLPPPQHFYHNLYHIQPIGPQDHDLKRQYLALLPPQQIIEICLTFDVHVPPYVKGTIWPPDIAAAIAALRKSTPSQDIAASAQKEPDKPDEPVMDSLHKPPEPSPVTEPPRETPTTEPQSSENQPENTQNITSTSTQTQTLPSETSVPPPAPPPAHLPPQQPQYPHQPYGYLPHTPVAYPHAPYYPPPPGYPSYPPSSYPHYPPVPNGYHAPPPPHPGYPPPPNPMYPTPHVSQPPTMQDQNSDDLPSYEEMIVEALQESTDPEGCAPKDLFAWMAARYPLQSNFRPSASQALQKAFKRGRFEKSSNGKYRLSATWEGGNTSRRTTRRPQTQSQSQSNSMTVPTSISPFTHTPLVHHQHHPTPQNPHPQHYPGQPYPYPYGNPVPGYPGYPPQPQQPHPTNQPLPSSQPQNPSDASKNGSTDKSTAESDVDKDAYEAAQNILKAINFGDLFQMAQDNDNGKKTDDVSMDQLTSLLVQAQSGLLSNSVQMNNNNPAVAMAQQQPVIPMQSMSGPTFAPPQMGGPASMRAELQAQLALLAAQLADLGQENGQSILPVEHSETQTGSQEQQQPQFEPPPMGALLPPPPEAQVQGTTPQLALHPPPPVVTQSELQPQPQPEVQSHTPQPHQPQSQPQPQPRPQQLPLTYQYEDIPIDPALQFAGTLAEMIPSSIPAPQPLPSTTMDSAIAISPETRMVPSNSVQTEVSSSNTTTAENTNTSVTPTPVSVAPELPGPDSSLPIAESQPQPHSDLTAPVVEHVPPHEPSFEDAEDDSDDDDDMEEIA